MLQPILYYVLVKPRRAPKKAGSIILPEDTRDADEATNTVGQIVKLGSLAFKAKTPGLDYNDEEHKPKVGDWVRYAKHSGQRFTVREGDGEDSDVKYVVISDTDVLGVIPPDEVDKHRGWV